MAAADVVPLATFSRRTGRRLRACLLLTLAVLPPGASAQEPAGDPAAPTGARPRVALVLGGGGARGLSHIGVLQRLEELRVPVDLVVGTSMGAIVGALYASGWTCPELEAWLEGADWAELFRDQPSYRDLSFRRKRDMLAFPIHLELGLSRRGISTPSGLIAGQKLNAELRRLLLPVATISDFDHLPLPFRAIATDLETGEMVVLARGDLVDAVRASMTAPGVFSPYEVGGRLLVDGGLTRNLPADVARKVGADVLIVVDVGTPLYTREELTTPVRAARQVATMLVESSAADQRRGLTAADVLIEPDLGPVGATDFGRWREALAAGRMAADESAEALRELAVPAAEYDAWRAGRRPPDRLPPVVDFVVLGDAGNRAQVSMLPRLRMVSGGPLDTAAIREDVVRLYGLGIYERVDYRLMWNGSDLALVYDPRPKPWGPNFLRFRVGVADNLAGEGSFTLAASLRMPQLNAW